MWDRSVRRARNNDGRPSRKSTEAARVFLRNFNRFSFSLALLLPLCPSLEITSSRRVSFLRGRAPLETPRSRENQAATARDDQMCRFRALLQGPADGRTARKDPQRNGIRPESESDAIKFARLLIRDISSCDKQFF